MENKKTYRKPSFFDGVAKAIREEAKRRKSEPGALFCDILVLAVSLFFARRHLIAGSYPLAPALVAVLPSRVWISLLGAVTGALTLGKSGIIHAIILIIVVFLRVIISAAKTADNRDTLFGEPLVMRVAAVTVASFVGAVYEILLSGFSLSSALFGVFGVLLSVAFSFIYSGFFALSVTVSDVLYGTKNIFSQKDNKKDKFELWFFQGSALAFAFLIPFSLEGYDFFGITPSYLVCTFMTLFVAKRFGAARAMAVGFASALGISSVQAVSFALLGASAGILFAFGAGYAVVFGGALLVAWSSYAGGLVGFLEVFPEYTVAALLLLPTFKRTPTERTPEKSEGVTKEAEDMVSTMAMARKWQLSYTEELEDLVGSLPFAFRKYAKRPEEKIDEIREKICAELLDSKIEVNSENIEKIATKVYKNQGITLKDCEMLGSETDKIFDVINSICIAYRQESEIGNCAVNIAAQYEYFAKMVAETRRASGEERVFDAELSERLFAVFSSFGFPDGRIKAYGSRRKYIVGAGADAEGKTISSPELHKALEGAVGGRLSKPEFFRKGELALFECTLAPAFTVEYATATAAAGGGISGDSVMFFSRDDAFYSLVSDGMGTGAVAKRTSNFVTDFLARIIHPAFDENAALAVLNHSIFEMGEECSATVDMLKIDLLYGEAEFIKSGAAPSYVKRDGSIFRIRSRTAPIGLMRGVDAERIKVEIKSGDVAVMLSDGVSGADDSPWLVQLLNERVPENLSEYAEKILAAAKRHSGGTDDMSVAVVRLLRK